MWVCCVSCFHATVLQLSKASPEGDPVLGQLGQSMPLSEQQLEQVGGETSAALYVPNTKLL